MRLPLWTLGLLTLAEISLATPAHAITVVVPGAEAWVIESAEYTGRVEERLVRLEAVYTIRVDQASNLPVIPLPLRGVVVTEAQIEQGRDGATLVPQGSAYALRVAKRGHYRVRLACSQLLTEQAPFEGLQFAVPQATFSTLVLTVPHQAIELRPEDKLYMSVAPIAAGQAVRLTAKLGASTQVDVRWRIKPVTPMPVEPLVYGEVQTLVTYEERVTKLWAVAQYRITQGELKQCRIVLPPTLQVQHVRGEAIEEWRLVEDGAQKLLQVTLQSPRKEGLYQLVLEGEQPLAAEEAEAALPMLRLMGVKQERGFIAAARSGSLEIAPSAIEGLQRIDVRELPPAFAAASAEPVLLAFKYHQHPYRGSIAFTRHADHPVLAAIAERGELVTILAQQGELLTRASYLVKGNKKQFLEVRLPEGATLWSCLVAGRTVKPVAGQTGTLLVPLEGQTEPTQGVAVELVYFQRQDAFDGIGRLQLQGPLLDVPTTVSNWVLYAPKGLKFLRFSGNVSPGAAAWAYLEPLPITEPLGMGAARFASARSGRDVMRDEDGGAAGGKQRQSVKSLVAKIVDGTTASKPESGYRENYERDDQPQSAEEQTAAVLQSFNRRLQETGVLPLHIRLPRAGVVHQFNRLMTTGEALSLQATFVHAPWINWMHFSALGLILPLAGFAVARRRA